MNEMLRVIQFRRVNRARDEFLLEAVEFSTRLREEDSSLLLPNTAVKLSFQK
jgi:hypothetical protein